MTEIGPAESSAGLRGNKVLYVSTEERRRRALDRLPTRTTDEERAAARASLVSSDPEPVETTKRASRYVVRDLSKSLAPSEPEDLGRAGEVLPPGWRRSSVGMWSSYRHDSAGLQVFGHVLWKFRFDGHSNMQYFESRDATIEAAIKAHRARHAHTLQDFGPGDLVRVSPFADDGLRDWRGEKLRVLSVHAEHLLAVEVDGPRQLHLWAQDLLLGYIELLERAGEEGGS
jgi:hypothetical protein